jgi:hypothetical protein
VEQSYYYTPADEDFEKHGTPNPKYLTDED